MLLHELKIKDLYLKNNVIIAPMAGYTNKATRKIYREQGASFCYCEMVSAMGLYYSFDKSIQLIDLDEEDHPIGVQLFGDNEYTIYRAYNLIKNINFDLIDINCGCSVKKIIKAKSGAYLLKKPDTIYKIIKILKENTDKPVTIKIRSGWDQNSINYLEVLDAATNAGVDLVTLHPRTQSMLFKGKADWRHIKEIKEKSKVPIIGNGDIFKGEDAIKMINETGCDGVMLARGVIENPFLVEEVITMLNGEKYTPPNLDRRKETLLKHVKLMIKELGEKEGLINFRKFFSGYVKGLPNASKIRQINNQILTFKEFEYHIENYFKEVNILLNN